MVCVSAKVIALQGGRGGRVGAAAVVLLVGLAPAGVEGAANVAKGAWMPHSQTLCLACV